MPLNFGISCGTTVLSPTVFHGYLFLLLKVKLWLSHLLIVLLVGS